MEGLSIQTAVRNDEEGSRKGISLPQGCLNCVVILKMFLKGDSTAVSCSTVMKSDRMK